MKVRGMEKREVIVDIICDRCKKSCKLSDSLGNISYAELNAKWPYGSYKDTEHHQLHLCEIHVKTLSATCGSNGAS